jgi:type III secretion protein T
MIDLDPIRQFLVVFAVSVVRLTAACSVVPFMGDQVVSGQVRNSLIFSWGIIVYPIVAPTVVGGLGTPLDIVAILAKEVFLGIMIGFLAAKVFWIAMSVGFFIDNQRGSSMAQVFDPTSGEQTSPVGQFLQQTMVTLFFISGGMLVFLGGVFESYVIWPVKSYFPTFGGDFPAFILEIGDDLMRTVVILSAPIIILLFLTDFGLGLVNRFAPQLNVFFLAMPVKCLVALFVLVLYMPLLLTLLGKEQVGGLQQLELLRNLLE